MKNNNHFKPALKVSFLGGVGEIGKNMTAIEFGNDIIIVDCGSTFPNGDMPGIDLVIPDTTYLQANKEKIKGIVITHGHEDHIGALPYILRDINVPVYGTKITLSIIDSKLREHKLESVKLNIVKAGSTVQLGCFRVEFVNVSHSIAGSCALAIYTPIGTIFHSGDFKVDYTPVAGNVTDLSRIAEIGNSGVLLLLCESTNVERIGTSISESKVGESLSGLFADNAKRRLIIATFASNIHRIQQILDLAVKYKRKVAFCGRSMLNIADVASSIGELRYDKSTVVDIDKIKNIPDENLVIITTGSQGEPMSALARMAAGELNKVTLCSTDTVILSASPIPGNERLVYNVINNIYRYGSKVVYESLAEIHASGHAYQEELKLIHSLIKPKFFIPVHGEHRHQRKHAELAMKMGVFSSNIVLPDIGNQVLVSQSTITLGDNIPSGAVLVDGLGVGDVGSTVLRDRKHLAEEGLFVVVIGIDKLSGIVGNIDIMTRGFVYAEESEELLNTSKKVVESIVSRMDLRELEDYTALKNIIKKDLKGFLYKNTRRSPMIIPVVVEV